MGSILAMPQSLNKEEKSYLVEGTGYDFIPNVLDREFVDYWMKTEDKESFEYSRKLIRDEGLFCGGSSGSVLYSAIKFAKEHNLNEKHRIVIVLADHLRNYITKMVTKEWMIEKGFIPYEELLNEYPNHPL